MTVANGDQSFASSNEQAFHQVLPFGKFFREFLPTEISRDILDVMCSKLTHICVCFFEALADASLKETCDQDFTLRTFVDSFAEVISVDEAAGARFIPLAEYNPSDFHPRHSLETRLASMRDMVRNFPGNRKGPFRQIQRAVVTEIDSIVGHVVRDGERLGIRTPVCRKLIDLIHALETGKRQFSAQT